jgi:poly(A) polymerase
MTTAPDAARALLAEPALARLLALLDADGETARVVGGAVRNILLGRPVHEVDIATSARPEAVIARAKAAHLRSVPTGVAHGTVTVIVAGRGFEVTTLREDVETDGRHAKVRFGRDFAADAQRRDFTINALSLDRDGEIHDYTGGLADIAAARVRFIGDPAQRIREDFLRTLRFFRFSADYAAGAPDAAGLAAAIAERDGLQRLSRERVRNELLKLLAARRAADLVEAFTQTGLLGPLLAAAPWPARLRRLIERRGDEADPVLRLAALCVGVTEDTERLRERLRLSNDETKRIAGLAAALVRLHGAEAPPDQGVLRGLLFQHGRTAALDALALAEAAARAPSAAAFAQARAFLRDTPEPHLPISGADLMARGITDGRAIGQALKALQALWIREGFPQEPRVLMRLLDSVAGGPASGD